MTIKQKQSTILITGATSGIGYATAKLLSDKGCQVVIHGRDRKTASAACAQINAPELTIPVWGDLASLRQTHLLAKQIKKSAPAFDVVILNAGIFQKGGLLSADGFEMDFAVNYLSQLLLTHLLMLQSCLTPGARIIFVSSSAYINGKVDINNLGEQYLNDPMMAYATSKQLCLIAALELASRLFKTKICVNACNPGPTDTQLLNAGKNYGSQNSGSSLVKAAHRLEWLALDPQLKTASGHYFNGKQTPNVPKRVRDEKITAALYETSMRLCKIRPLPSNLPL